MAVVDIAADQEASGPTTRLQPIIVFGIEISEFSISPVEKPGTFGAFAGGQSLPGIGGKIACKAVPAAGGVPAQEPK